MQLEEMTSECGFLMTLMIILTSNSMMESIPSKIVTLVLMDSTSLQQLVLSVEMPMSISTKKLVIFAVLVFTQMELVLVQLVLLP